MFGMWRRKNFANLLWRGIIIDNIYTKSKPCLHSTFGTASSKHKSSCGYLPLLTWRRLEAHRSVLIQYGNRLGKLLQWLQKSGRVQNVFCFDRAERTLALVEFADVACVDHAKRRVVHFPNDRRLPVPSRLFFFRRSLGRDQPLERMHARHVFFERERTLSASDLISAQSVSAQMQLVHSRQQLTELDVRLRFFVASCVEESMRGLFPEAMVTPFGSSVNGFGRHGCDLDMVLDLESQAASAKPLANSAMCFLTKQRSEDSRSAAQGMLDAVAGTLQYVTPQCMDVRRVLHARVPIVKFFHSSTDIACDLCLENRSVLLMSQLLYTYGELDPRVRPLIFVVRYWARSVGVTFAGPGPWISNFMLALLSVFYLQQAGHNGGGRGAVLPPLTQVADVVKVGDSTKLEYNFITDISTIRKSSNKQSLESLLRGFFEFYARADLSMLTPSLHQVEPLSRPPTAMPDVAMYIENPFDRDLNVAKNVLQSHADAFQRACECAMEQLVACGGRTMEQPWGLMHMLSSANAELCGTDSSTAADNFSIDVGGIFEQGEESKLQKEQ